MHQLRTFIRKHQRYNILGEPVVAAGLVPATLVDVYGMLDQTYIEVTNDVSDLTKISFTFTTKDTTSGGDSAVNGTTTAGNFSPKKSLTGQLTFEGATRQTIQGWLVDDINAPNNSFDVKFLDITCGEYTGYVMTAQAITWCEGNALCVYDVTLIQADDLLQCIQRTLIHDNWQGWFQTQPLNGKKHPRFAYCVEIRPNSTLIIEWFGLSVNFASLVMVLLPVVTIFNSVAFIVNLLGGDLPYADPAALINSALQEYVESAGCGREHIGVLIRDYISNVCMKCKVTVNAETAPIFFAPQITYNTVRGDEFGTNDYYNACYLFPQLYKGVRRFHNLNVFGASDEDTTTFWQQDNVPPFALDQFLDQVKTLFNAEWRLWNGTLYIERKDWYEDIPPIFDFSQFGADRPSIIDGICYAWNEEKYPAAAKGCYQDDQAEKTGHEAAQQMNGIVEFGYSYTQPNYYGILDKTCPFGATKFALDGASTDYVYDAMQVIMNGQLLQPWTFGQMSLVGDKIRDYHDYALLLSSETMSAPKVVIWNPNDGSDGGYRNARAIRLMYSAYPGTYPGLGVPNPNTDYPFDVPNVDGNGNVLLNPFGDPLETQLPLAWQDPRAHEPQSFVIGSNLTFANRPPGIYKVTDYTGMVITQNSALLVNYPMYFEPHYRGTLWDRFHWIDDPKRNPKKHQTWNLKIPLCCDSLQRLGITGEGINNDQSMVKLLYTVKLDSNYYSSGIIQEIVCNYDPTGDVGSYIELSGIL